MGTTHFEPELVSAMEVQCAFWSMKLLKACSDFKNLVWSLTATRTEHLPPRSKPPTAIEGFSTFKTALAKRWWMF
jgi:hypothetical protein